jgi:hypothetical protein
VWFSLSAGKKQNSALEICPLDDENSLYIKALHAFMADRIAAEFCAPFREKNGIGSGLGRDFGMAPAGGLSGIENSYSN